MKRLPLITALIAGAIISQAAGLQVSVSGGDARGRSSVSMNFDVSNAASVNSQLTINGAVITSRTSINGPIMKFEQTHSVNDASGKRASVYVKVLKVPSGLVYSSQVLPSDGNVPTSAQVSAEQWLTVPKAYSITCTANAFNGASSAGVGLTETESAANGGYVTLTGYDGKAIATATSVTASQMSTSGSANSITINGSAIDSSGSYSVNTLLGGISNEKAVFSGLSDISSAGTTTQVGQDEHLHGSFTSTAICKPKIGAYRSKTRTSNYGTDYDLNMMASKESSATGIVGYYVGLSKMANRIQNAINAAQSGDTINVAKGTYKENVKIDKSLTIKGAGATKTIIDGSNSGSVFSIGTVNPNAVVALSDLKITKGSGTSISGSIYGGGIFNMAKLTVTNCMISENRAYSGGGGIDNWGGLTVTNSTISGNSADCGGGGIFNWDRLTVTNSTISGNSGGGICNIENAAVSYSAIFGNSADCGGGIDNGGIATISDSTISGNSADSGGGGINNWGGLMVTNSTGL